jgi:hypothetical protein
MKQKNISFLEEQNVRQCKKISVISILLVIILCSFWSYDRNHDHITTIKSFSEVDFNAIDRDTLVVFDVDETLIQPTDMYYINEGSPQAQAVKKKLIEGHPEIKDWSIYQDILIKQVQRPLLEPMIVAKINALQKIGVVVIAVTAMNTGKYGSYDRLERWRYEHLGSFGFEGSFNELIIDFESNGKKPVFYKGILATDLSPKGPALFAFLDHIKHMPKKVIMFDDNKSFLESVAAESTKHGIEFQGYWYKGAHEKAWDQALIEFQIEHLLKHKKWISDEQAQVLIQAELIPACS